MKTHDDYFHAITGCMITFQYIEEAIKMVLVRLESLIHFRIKGYSPYKLKPKYNSITNAAMGRLIGMLSIYTDDDDLIAELKKIKDKRDDIVHRGLLMTVEEADDLETIQFKTVELDELDESAKLTLTRLLERWRDLDKTLNKVAAE